MSIKNLNLTQIKVTQELEVLALIHPSPTSRILLNNPEFRQNLLDYILKKVTNKYLLIESQEEFYEILRVVTCTTQERRQIYNLVDQRLNELRNRKKTSNPSRLEVNHHILYSLRIGDKQRIS